MLAATEDVYGRAHVTVAENEHLENSFMGRLDADG